MELVLVGLLALVVGGVFGWILGGKSARSHSEQQAAALELQAAAREKQAADAFARLAADALQRNSEQLAQLAQARLATTSQVVKDDGEKRELALRALIDPLQKSLEKVQLASQNLEKVREGAYSDLKVRLEELAKQTTILGEQSRSLSTTLKGSAQARGQWGEMVLRNVAEVSGMLEHCDFELQAQTGAARPDMSVKLPGGGWIPVDAKVPLDAYAQACDATDARVQKELFAKHALMLRGHVKALKARDYTRALGSPVDFTVLFLPADALLSAAFQSDPELQADAMRERVLIATPVTLVALLRTVSLYWQQHKTDANAKLLTESAAKLQGCVVKFAEHLGGIGKGLSTALDAYNDAIGSYKERLLPQGRRVEELLGAQNTQSKVIPEVSGVDAVPRRLN
ncbi:MAG: DNA recombination protein RmuC [Planctomycetes bacterium]|nr:DNA recombination protein RmuC [Planctomycetota bacterium]